MKILISKEALDALIMLEARFRDSLPRVIFLLKMPRGEDKPVVGFIPSDFMEEIHPLSEVAGLKIYVDEPKYLFSILTGKYIDATVGGSFFVRDLAEGNKSPLIEVDIFEK